MESDHAALASTRGRQEPGLSTTMSSQHRLQIPHSLRVWCFARSPSCAPYCGTVFGGSARKRMFQTRHCVWILFRQRNCAATARAHHEQGIGKHTQENVGSIEWATWSTQRAQSGERSGWVLWDWRTSTRSFAKVMWQRAKKRGRKNQCGFVACLGGTVRVAINVEQERFH